MGRKKNSALLEAVETAEKHVGSAIDHAKDFLEDTAKPALSDAREKAAPVVADARQKAAPVMAAGAATVAAKAAQAKDFAEAKAAEVSGQQKPKKRSKLKMLFLFGAIAGAVAFAAKKLQGGGSDQGSPWQSDYTPAPPPTPSAPATPTAVEDPATEEDVTPDATHGDPLGDESR